MFDIIIGRDEEEKKRYGMRGTILVGKQFVKMGATTSMSNNIYMDVNRSHVIFICGKRGCLSGDTKIFTNHGFKPIEEFDEKEDKIMSYDTDKKKFMWESAELLKYPISNEDLIEFELADGHKIVATEEHPLLVFDGKNQVWKNARDIKEDELILSAAKVPEVKNDKESVRIARLLGFLLADGTMNKQKGRWKDGRGYWYDGEKRRLRIFNRLDGVLKTAKKDLEKEFGIIAKRYERNDCDCGVVETKQGKVVRKFEELGVPLGKKSAIIRVPRIVFESSNRFKTNFLKALFSCDGFVSKDGSRIMYYSNSRLFLTDLNLILSHFNIHSKIREKKTSCNGRRFTSHLLDIMDYASIQNFRKIGFFDPSKTERLKKRKFNQVERRKGTKYFSGNIFTQKIRKILRVRGISEVYDLTVPKNHSFIANGIISHNSGKSYTMGVLAEGMADLPEEVSSNISVIMLDTMGIYWTMKYPNQKDDELLRQWGLKGKGLDVKIFTPTGYYKEYREKGIPTDSPFSIKPSELDIDDWVLAFGIEKTSELGVLLERSIWDVREKKKDFSMDDVISAIKKNPEADPKAKNAVENLFLNAKNWGIFDENGTELAELSKGGQVTVLDVSCYATMPGGWAIKALAVGLISKKLFIDRMVARKNEEFEEVHGATHYFGEEKKQKRDFPLVWLVIDEAHEFLPVTGKVASSDALITILREGRQPGISLILATQQPGKIHTDVLTQADTVIAHRITAKLDVDALGTLMQSYMREGLTTQLDNLPSMKGAAIVFDDTNERMYPMRLRPRLTWHGGSSPNAIRDKKEGF